MKNTGLPSLLTVRALQWKRANFERNDGQRRVPLTWNWRLIVQEQECAEQTGEKYREKEKWEQKEEIRVKNCRGKQKKQIRDKAYLGKRAGAGTKHVWAGSGEKSSNARSSTTLNTHTVRQDISCLSLWQAKPSPLTQKTHKIYI